MALPTLWDGFTDDELLGILVPFRECRSEAENLTSLLAELATLNPMEMAQMVSTGFGRAAVADLLECLCTLLNPRRLGHLRRLVAEGALRAMSRIGGRRGDPLPTANRHSIVVGGRSGETGEVRLRGQGSVERPVAVLRLRALERPPPSP